MTALFTPILAFLKSSIGRKILVALTGLALAGFVLGHMVGNLLVFVGPEALNAYGHKLQSMGPLLWIARIGLLVMVVVHVVLTIQLTKENRAARAERYGYQQNIQSSKSSRVMIFSGLTVLAFIIYHLLHFTVRAGNDYATYTTVLHGETVHDVYKMVIAGFSWWPATLFYVISMILLSSHLSHGVASVFQTLGIATARTWPAFQKLGYAFAAIILVGNCSIPLAVWLGFVR